MNDQRYEFHVAQQSRRDKLRFPDSSTSSHLVDYPTNLEQLSFVQPLSYQQLKNTSYGSPVAPSEMLNFAPSSHTSVSPKVDSAENEEWSNASFANFSQPVASNFTQRCGDTQNCGNWKSVDWNVTNYSSESAAAESDVNPMFVGESSCQYSHEKHYGDLQFTSFYQNTLQEVVTSAIGARSADTTSFTLQSVKDTGHGWWTDIPNYVDKLSQKNISDLRRICHENSNTQTLALSLSPAPSCKSNKGQIGERNTIPEGLYSKQFTGSTVLGDAARKGGVGSLSFTHRNVVPFGPFTGYATIMKSSKFLKPAQQLLSDFCNLAGSKDAYKDGEASNKVREGVSITCDDVNTAESSAGAIVGDSGDASSSFYSSNAQNISGGVRSTVESYVQPEYLQKKAKLLVMQDEISKRYKQYQQQMQMVFSSFDSVAGLSAATPYISRTLNMLSRQFRSLRNSISDQLRKIRQALEEQDVQPSHTTVGLAKGGEPSSRLKFGNETLPKQRSDHAGSLNFYEAQQNGWRPQRGLPERAVTILRAWLFDHFLHPYPTDSDKHMLATQTGLTRNQVSNWFINARVRVWKPMVEEIHNLESKGMAETHDRKLMTARVNQENDGLHSRVGNIPSSVHYFNRFNTSDISGISSLDRLDADLWKNQEKRSRLDCDIPMSSQLMDFVPYQRNKLESGGLGAVSLTLGLRQTAEGVQQQQQQQRQQQMQQEYRYRQQF